MVNLAPADIPKAGTGFDLPIAMAILASSNQCEFDLDENIFMGELALDGKIRRVGGGLSAALECKRVKIENLFLSKSISKEASLVDSINVYGAITLNEIVDHLNQKNLIPRLDKSEMVTGSQSNPLFDFASIKGQESVKRAAIIAASGGHNLLLSGTPGSGKTMIAKALPSILPNLTFEESVELTKIYSVANLLDEKREYINFRPFRSPHHTASTTSIIGGGKYPKPGELSLSHRGVLFLDEFTEFSSLTLEALRQPLEDKQVIVSRVSGTLNFPANFMLVAAMNPCKCGWLGDPERECSCTPFMVEKYKKKISGPILDRIDIQVNVPRVKVEELAKYKNLEKSSSDIKIIVQNCRDIQIERYKKSNIVCNADLPQKFIEKYCPISSDALEFLLKASQKLNLSARSYFRLIRVGRTIADLETSVIIERNHIAEALQYRINE